MSDKQKYAVQVRNVRKKFSYSSNKNNSLKRAITQAFKPKDNSKDSFYALDDISFNVEKGDFFGILGRNGSGKSTLLKIISEIYQPTSGSVKHDGKIVSFIELGVGFKSELTGKENVYLNGGLLGFSKKEVDSMYDDIVAFAELEDFMDQQLKNYSSGMKVRLAFSVAIRAKADVLILDEVLAVGDAAFQKKCTDYFETLKDDGKTVILVTHSMGNVRRFCNKAVVIDSGKVVFEGEANEAADEYLKLFKSDKSSKSLKRNGTYRVKMSDLSIEVSKSEITVDYTITSKEKIDGVKVAIDVRKKGGPLIAGIPGAYFSTNPISVNGTHKGRVVFENKLFDADYALYIRLRSASDEEIFDDWSEAAVFTVNTNGVKSGIPSDLFLENKSTL